MPVLSEASPGWVSSSHLGVNGCRSVTGDSIAFLRAVMCGEIRPEPAQMAAALALAKPKRPAPTANAQVDWAEVCKEARPSGPSGIAMMVNGTSGGIFW
jgi:hypothetical protein